MLEKYKRDLAFIKWKRDLDERCSEWLKKHPEDVRGINQRGPSGPKDGETHD